MKIEIDLVAWLRGNLGQLDAFNCYWCDGHEKDPKNWPFYLNHGEWDAQYESFCAGLLDKDPKN